MPPPVSQKKAQVAVRRTPLPSLPQRTYGSPWEELAMACQMLPAADASARLRWLFRAAEIWEQGAADISRAFDTLSRAMILAGQTPGGDTEARARLHRLAADHGAWDRLADLYLDLADGASTVAAAVDLLLEVARIREQQERPRDAETQYRRVLGMAPADEAARSRLEALYRDAERWVELAASLEERTDPRLGIAAPEAERPALLRELAGIYVDRLGRPHDAIDALERLRQLAPEDVDVLTSLGELYVRVGRWSKVIETLSRVGDVAEGTPAAREALRRIAEIYDGELELPERAMESYAQLVAHWPDDQSAYAALDKLYQSHARWTDLVEVLRRRAALSAEPARRAELLARRAQVLLEWLGQAEEAAAGLRHARTILPDDPGLADQLVAALLAAKKGREAAAVLEGVIARATGSGPGARATGDEPSVVIAGDLAALWIRLAQIRFDELDDAKQARIALDKAMALVPDHPTALAQLARLTRVADDPAAFVAAKLREADAVGDDDARVAALMAAGEALRDQLQDQARARTAFERVLALRPYHADATWALAGLVEQAGDPDAAARLLEARLENDGEALPADEKARVLTQLAALARGAGVEAVAERRLTEALAASPAHVPAIVALADLYGDAARWDDLATWLEETIADDSTNLDDTPGVAAELHRRLAAAFEKQGRDEDAYQTLLAADRLHRGELLIKLALGENRYKARRWREASLHLGALATHEAAERYPAEVAQGLYHAALAEIRSLRPEKAPPLYARALELKPNFAPALQAMAEIAMEQGDHRRAADLLTRQATATEDPAERMRLFEALGDLALMLLSDEERARICYEAAVAAAQPLEARHLPLLAKLLERQDLAGDHLGAARTAELMAAFGATPMERAARFTRAAGDYLTGGDRERARAAAERAIDADPYDLDAVTLAADLLIAEGAHEAAATALGRALSAKDEGEVDEITLARRATLWLRLGQVRLSRGDPKNGVAALEKAIAVAPDSDGALEARRRLLDVLRPQAGAATLEPGKREQAIELLRAIAEASAKHADVAAWADELRRADRPEARHAIELVAASGHPLDVHQSAYLATHKAAALPPADAPYKGAITPDELATLIADPEERGLAPVASALAEAMALLVPDPEEILARVGAAGARRVSPAARLTAAEMFPRVASALGTGATVLYGRDEPGTADIQVVCAGTPMVVLGPRLLGDQLPPPGELRFLLGRAAALAQPARVIFAGAPYDDAARLLAAVMRSFGPPAVVAAAARLVPESGAEHAEEVQRRHDEHVRTTLPVRLRQHLQQLLAGVSPRELDLDVFLAGTDRAADRAGMLASDDPGAAFAHVRARGGDPTHLVRTALAPGWMPLRARLGWK
jgi:tetratricopeptide (TPR) repeat protein